MTQKRTLTANEQHQLREALQAATITALLSSRRWGPGELAFQGGTSLNLAHGSIRFSEDLDFMVRGGLPLDGLSKDVQSRLRLPAMIAKDLELSVSAAKDHRNPHAFVVTLAGPNVIGSAKVKVELWQTEQSALDSIKLTVSQIRSPEGIPSYVPTLTIDEILADKIYALGARDRIKPRDIYDLWWIQQTKPGMKVDPQKLTTRLDIYPAPTKVRADTACRWIANASKTLRSLATPGAAKLVSSDLQRWLPSTFLMNEAVASEMIKVATTQLQSSLAILQNEAGERDHG